MTTSSAQTALGRVARGVAAGVAVLAVAAALLAAPASAERSRVVSGWFGYWTDAREMITVARSSKGVLGEVNIFWWNYAGSDQPVCTSDLACPSSSAGPWTSPNLNRARAGLQAQGITVYATHTDLSGAYAGSLSAYLATKQHREAIASRLAGWAVRAGVDGVDLDWENFAFNDGSSSWDRTRPRLTDTVRRLATKLHARGKLLSVTVPGGYQPFLSSGAPNPGGGYSVYNWNRLAQHVDRLRLMTYDYSWNRPGPIGPQDWADDVVRSAIRQVGPANRRKLYVGLHQYGKAWYSRDASDDVITVGQCHRRWTPYGSDAIGLTPDEALAVARTYGVTPRLDPDSQEWTFDYVKRENGYWYSKGKRRERECLVRKEIWFGGAATAAARGRMVQRHGIGGIAVWQLASLADGFFGALAPFAKGGPMARRRAGLGVAATDTTPRAGSEIVVRGRLVPKAKGLVVKRQQLVRGHWRTMSIRYSSGKGRVRYSVGVPNAATTMKLRLKSPATGAHPKRVSRVLSIRSWR